MFVLCLKCQENISPGNSAVFDRLGKCKYSSSSEQNMLHIWYSESVVLRRISTAGVWFKLGVHTDRPN